MAGRWQKDLGRRYLFPYAPYTPPLACPDEPLQRVLPLSKHARRPVLPFHDTATMRSSQLPAIAVCASLRWKEFQSLWHHVHGRCNLAWLSRPIRPSFTRPEKVSWSSSWQTIHLIVPFAIRVESVICKSRVCDMVLIEEDSMKWAARGQSRTRISVL